MYFRHDGVKIKGIYTDLNGNQYGQKWLLGATDEQLLDLEITKHDNPIKPDYDQSTQTVFIGDDGEYVVRDLTEQELEDRKPKIVSMRQARLALKQYGRLDDVDLAISQMPSPQKEYAEITWNSAIEVNRDDSTTNMLAMALNLSDSELDELFTLAVTL